MILEALAIYGGYKLLTNKSESTFECGSCREHFIVELPQRNELYICWNCGNETKLNL